MPNLEFCHNPMKLEPFYKTRYFGEEQKMAGVFTKVPNSFIRNKGELCVSRSRKSKIMRAKSKVCVVDRRERAKFPFKVEEFHCRVKRGRIN